MDFSLVYCIFCMHQKHSFPCRFIHKLLFQKLLKNKFYFFLIIRVIIMDYYKEFVRKINRFIFIEQVKPDLTCYLFFYYFFVIVKSFSLGSLAYAYFFHVIKLSQAKFLLNISFKLITSFKDIHKIHSDGLAFISFRTGNYF
jgi:hypothetical protein